MNLQENFESEELVALARLDMEKQDFSSALAKLKSAVAMENASTDSYSMLAKVYAQLGLYEKAIAQFEVYLQRAPEALVEKFQLGMAQFDAKKTTEALATWGELLISHPDFPPALYYKSLALVQEGMKEPAIETLAHLIQTAAADNLYCERAQQILQDLQGEKASKISVARKGTNVKH